MLEIQYDNEVGTGLGPTLEFYALVSAEVQRCDLGLWNGSDSYRQNSSSIMDVVKSSVVNIDDEPANATAAAVAAQMSASIINNEDVVNMLLEKSENMMTNMNELIDDQAETTNATSDNIVVPPVREQRQPAAYVNAPFGLFPIPIGRAAKLSQVSRLKAKFKFLGKFMAKAVMDSRMVSL